MSIRRAFSTRIIPRYRLRDHHRDVLAYEALIVGLITFTGYAMTFMYEYGFCIKFGIPTGFISISLTSVFITIGIIVAIFIFWLFSAFLLSMLLKKPTLKNSPIYGITLLFILLLIIYWGAWLNIIAFVFLYVLYLIIALILWNREKKRRTNDKEKKPEHKVNSRMNAPIWRHIPMIGKMGFMIIGFSVLFILVAFIAGTANAEKQTNFLIPSTSENSVVLRVYGDNMICAPFDRDNQIIQRSFFIIKMGDSTETSFQFENVGPLR